MLFGERKKRMFRANIPEIGTISIHTDVRVDIYWCKPAYDEQVSLKREATEKWLKDIAARVSSRIEEALQKHLERAIHLKQKKGNR